jgi:predicted molibdopterin-dependent oxidoreductase YjgC
MDAGSVTVWIDGLEVEVAAGSSILDACDRAGVYVPRLCAHPGLEALGDCGLCFVKVEDAARRACSVVVRSGMRVDTHDEEVLGFRTGSMKAILGDHPHVCLACPLRDGCGRDECTYGEPPEARCCDEFGRCEIAKVAEHVGALVGAPTYVHRGLAGVVTDHNIRRDVDLCIGCGRCVAACDTLEEAGRALALVETRTVLDRRSEGESEWEPQSYLGRHVALPKDADLASSGCTFCGACVMVCPAGALTAAGARGAGWLAKRRERTTLCPPQHPPVVHTPFSESALAGVPHREGVFRLYSDSGELIQVAGVVDLHAGLTEAARSPLADEIASFDFEFEPLYTQRESEYLARHLHEHGRMPRGNDILGALFDDDQDEPS